MAVRFDRLVAKYVRRGHVQTSDDWLRSWRQAKFIPTGSGGMESPREGYMSAGGGASDAGADTLVEGGGIEGRVNGLGLPSDGAHMSTLPAASVPTGSSNSGSGRGGNRATARGGKGGRGGGGRSSGGGGAASALKLPKLLVLVGLPGSGKSTFAEQLVASGRGWTRVSQDECGGSRRSCEAAFGIAALRGNDHGRHVILDR